jgi:hypothetical protein
MIDGLMEALAGSMATARKRTLRIGYTINEYVQSDKNIKHVK